MRAIAERYLEDNYNTILDTLVGGRFDGIRAEGRKSFSERISVSVAGMGFPQRIVVKVDGIVAAMGEFTWNDDSTKIIEFGSTRNAN